MKKPYEILFEDDHLVIVNKAAGLLTIPDRYQHDKANLSGLMAARYGEIFIVHRLDRETSGAIMFAKDAETHKKLSAMFESGEINKYYLAILQGVPPLDEGLVETFIVPSETVKGKMMVYKKGKPSKTGFRVKENYDNKYSFVELKLFTGRTHQIRVHMEYLGNPLLVDYLYSKTSEFKLSQIKRRKFRLGKNEEERPLISRHTLHSSKVSFTHPITKESIEVEAPLPKDMRAVLNQMRKIVGVVE